MGIRSWLDQARRYKRRRAVLAAALVLGLLASMMVAEPGRAAFVPPYQTNFEIDGNTAVNGVPPGAGVDWANAATSVKGYTNKPTEPCTGQHDDTLGGDSLATLDTLRPVV